MTERILRAKSIIHGRPDEALKICNDILNEEFDSVEGQMALFMSGYIMMQAERYGLAYQIYQRCAQLRPDMSEIWSNMGMCLEEHDPAKAKNLFNRAIRLNPKNYDAMANKGLMCLQTGKPQQCIDLCNAALKGNPSLEVAIHNRGLARLMLRDWGGWEDYYHTLGVKHREARDYGAPEWGGEKGTVLVYGEQGVGDEIMFASCLPDLMKTNKVIFDCDARLEKLFRRSFNCEVYGDRFKTESRAADQSFDYQCAIGQLPYFFRKKDEDYTGSPYLIPPKTEAIKGKGRKIGIAWRGGLARTGEARRSLKIEDLEPIFTKDDTFISLEYKDVDQETLNKYELLSFPETKKGQDIDDLAGLIGGLDLVITCCTTVVYIAGALGVPCRVLVPRNPGYRYHLDGHFPWFKSVKLFRQKTTWRNLAEEVALA